LAPIPRQNPPPVLTPPPPPPPPAGNAQTQFLASGFV
jgi:hypothetical protein